MKKLKFRKILMVLKNRRRNNLAKIKKAGDSGEDAGDLQRMNKELKKDALGNLQISQEEDSTDGTNLMDLSMDHQVDLNQNKTKRPFLTLILMDLKDSLDLSL